MWEVAARCCWDDCKAEFFLKEKKNKTKTGTDKTGIFHHAEK